MYLASFTVGSLKKARTHVWTEEDNKKLFLLYKEMGSHWSEFTKYFSGLTENQIKSRFYSTLRRVAAKKTHITYGKAATQMRKEFLVQFVDDAILYGHSCKSKRGRKPQGNKHLLDKTLPYDLPITPTEEKKQDNLSKEGDGYVDDIERNQERLSYQGEIQSLDNYDRSSCNEEYHGMQLSFKDCQSLPPINLNYIYMLFDQNIETLEILEKKAKPLITDAQALLEVINEARTKLRETQSTIREVYRKYMIDING